jgi:hypothetical protein
LASAEKSRKRLECRHDQMPSQDSLFRARVRASYRSAWVRDILVLASVTAFSWLTGTAGANTARTLVLNLSIGLAAVLVVEILFFAYRFSWAVPKSDYFRMQAEIDELRSGATSPIRLARVSHPDTLLIAVTNTGATAEVTATLTTSGLAESDLHDVPAVWRHDRSAEKAWIAQGTTRTLIVAELSQVASRTFRWSVLGRTPHFGTERLAVVELTAGNAAATVVIELTAVWSSRLGDGVVREKFGLGGPESA